MPPAARTLPALLALAAVAAPAAAEAPSFRRDVMAVLSRGGCNGGPCHGNLNGKGGFRLSLRGEDPAKDFLALTRDQLGRRVDVPAPDQSLILRKAVGTVPHEGGARFSPRSPEAELLRAWVAAGARDDAGAPPLAKLDVTPGRQVLPPGRDKLPLAAQATFADGSTRDVTGLATYETTTLGVAKVLPSGEVVREGAGDVVVLVRYLDRQVPVPLAFLPERPPADLSEFPAAHPVDALAAGQFRELRITPAARAPDSVFLRRLSLDLCGEVPSAELARRFLADPRPDKRARLVDELLARPEFSRYWAQKWADLLRNEEKSLDRKGVQHFYRWIRGWVEEDRPLTEFAAAVLTGQGNTYEHPESSFYRAVREPSQRAESAAQVFLGLRISCARCHNHPFDRWTQDDYHRFVALFAQVKYRVGDNGKKDDLDKHEFVGEQVVVHGPGGDWPHPRGGKAAPKFLGAETPDLSGRADRLGALAEWVAGPDNPFFARAQANRVWFHLFGRGLVDPSDDFRATNPASHEPLLEHLAEVFRAGGYRLKPLVRHVATSELYALASEGGESADAAHFARALVQPLEAEPLLDALAQVYEVPVRFPGYPLGTKAAEVPAPPQAGRRRDGSAVGNRFLKVFGKPDRLITCECERSEDPGLLQAFQMMTGELVTQMARLPDNRLGRRMSAGTDDNALLDELYLSALARYPTPVEREKLLSHVGRSGDKRAAWEDVAWGLVNAKEFLLRR